MPLAEINTVSELDVLFRPDGVFVHKRADDSFPVNERNNYERHVKWSEILLPVGLLGAILLH